MQTLGFHFCPSPQLLFDCLKKKASDNNIKEQQIPDAAGSPIVDRLLYSSEPWNVFSNDDPWEVDYSTEDKGYVERKIYVYVKLKTKGKRVVRTAGCGVWEGSTGYKPIQGDEGDQKGQILGFKGSFNYKVKSDLGVGDSYGEWRMNEFKLGGKILEGLEEEHLARVLVVCQITQKVDTKSQYYLSWPKGILDTYLNMLEQYGVFDPKEKEDSDTMRNIEAKRALQPLSESGEYTNKRQRMNEDEEKEFAAAPCYTPAATHIQSPLSHVQDDKQIVCAEVKDNLQFNGLQVTSQSEQINQNANDLMASINPVSTSFPSINPMCTSLDPNSWQYRAMFRISNTDVQDNPANVHVNSSIQDFNHYGCYSDNELFDLSDIFDPYEIQQMSNMSAKEFQVVVAPTSDDYKLSPVERMQQSEKLQGT